jgi:hypothetical protein
VVETDNLTVHVIAAIGRHLAMLCQRLPCVKRALFVICVENDYGTVANDIRRGLEEQAKRNPLLPRILAMEEDVRTRRSAIDDEPTITAGLRLLNPIKVKGVNIIDGLLRGGHLLFARQFAAGLAEAPAVGSSTSSVAEAAAATRDAIIGQLENYKKRITYKPGTGKNGAWRPAMPSIKYSGKDSLSQRDDWVSALLEIPLSMELFARTDRYVHARGLLS